MKRFYRQYQLLPQQSRTICFYLVMMLIMAIALTVKLSVGWRANLAKMRIGGSSQWLSLPLALDKPSQLKTGEAVRTAVWNVYNVPIYINDGHQIGYDLPANGHFSWLSVTNHVCVRSDLEKRQIFVAIPNDHPELAWMNQFPIPSDVVYFDATRSKSPPFEPLPLANANELGLVALSSMSQYGTTFKNQLETCVRNEMFWINLEDWVWSWRGLLLAMCISTGALLLLEYRPLPAMVQRHAQEAGLDESHTLALFQRLIPAWAEGRPTAGIEQRLRQEARALRREQEREHNRQRREKLNLLAGETRARKLAEEAEKRAQSARKRMEQGETTLGEEIAQLRRDTKTEGSQIAEVLESGFFEAVTADALNGCDSSAGVAAEPKLDRNACLSAIRSCAHDLPDLDRCDDDTLRSLSTRLRRVKREVSTKSFKQLKGHFRADQPTRFLQLLQVADEEGELALLEQIGTGTSRRLRSADSSIQEPIPRLLEGKSVILLGGDQSLGPFYIEQIEKLGAKVLYYHTEGNPIRLRNFKPDYFLLMYKRVDHKAQQMARSIGKIIYLAKVARKTFLSGAIQDIRAQMSTLD